jgi:hypothetical protein
MQYGDRPELWPEPVWPHELKLRRARKHLDDFKAEVKRWIEVDGYSTAADANPKAPRYIVRVRIERPIEEDPFSLLLGDFLQNARAALDHLAFALGDAGAGGAMDEATAAETMFPIIGDVDRDGFPGRGPDLFAAAAQKRLATVAEPARAVIEQLQPYHEYGDARTLAPLWILHELARFDRHRFVHLAAMYSGHLRSDPAQTRNIRIEKLDVHSGRLVIDPEEDGTEIARAVIHPADASRDAQVAFVDALFLGLDVDTLPPSLPYVDDMPIETVLFSIYAAVQGAIRALKRFLPPEPPR